MFDAQWWADELQQLIGAIPRAQGEDQDQKVARIARYAKVSRSTLYNILAGKQTRLFSIEGWIRVLQMIPPSKGPVKILHVQNILQASGVNLQGPPNIRSLNEDEE